jgi:alpha-L-fucosidase
VKGMRRTVGAIVAFTVAVSPAGGRQSLARDGIGPDQNGAPASPAKELVAAPVELPPPPIVKTVVRTGEEANRRVAWWQDAKVGMFIHYGLYAIPGKGEWVMWNQQVPRSEYLELANQFKPDPAAPYQWAAVAKRAGLKYAVLTSRHHDGFSLFNSSGNAFNTVETAAKQDVVQIFLEAMRSEGLRTGLYYSPLDWRYPGYFFPDLYLDSAIAMRTQYHREIDDLARNYGPIDLIWFDGGGKNWLGFGGLEFNKGAWRRRPTDKSYSGRFDWQDNDVVNRLRTAQPGIIINDRTDAPADWHSREGVTRLGEYDDQTPWELCFTLAGSWGYQPNAKPRSMEELVSLVTRVATRGGNTLINVGPAPDGSIPNDQIQRLEELGEWLATYGKAIYETRGGPFRPVDGVGSTRVGSRVFLHVLPDQNGRYPASVTVPVLKGVSMKQVQVVGSNTKSGFRLDGKTGYSIGLPAPRPNSYSMVIELNYDRPLASVDAGQLPPIIIAY